MLYNHLSTEETIVALPCGSSWTKEELNRETKEKRLFNLFMTSLNTMVTKQNDNDL